MGNSTHVGTCILHVFCWFANQNESEKKNCFLTGQVLQIRHLFYSSFVCQTDRICPMTNRYLHRWHVDLTGKKLEPLYTTSENRSVKNDFFP